jgi:N-acetylneuraminate synthase
MPVKIIAEIGINHNGDIKIAKKLIDVACLAGCDYVKFQKRNPYICVPENQKSVIKSTPWGEMTYLDYKHRLEFNHDQFEEIFDYCDSKEIKCFASVWDKDSVDFMHRYIDIAKIPSALITDIELCKYARKKNEELFVSTGMSTEREIEQCVKECYPDLIFHTNSTYPSPIEELNLSYISWLKNKFPDTNVGYSGHEYGLVPTFVAVVLGATYIERHITLNRTMWGSDQMASVEPVGLMKMTKAIRDIESSIGSGGPRVLFESEKDKKLTLRK